MCSLHINGEAHGPDTEVTTCQLHMRKFHDGDTITIEPWRSAAFPVIKDLVVERSAFDKIMQAGGFISVNTGGVPDANTIPVPRDDAEESMDAAACIGCGACVATCKNGSAMLFVAARVSSLAKLPQGKVETLRRAKAMIAKMVRRLSGSACLRSGVSEEYLHLAYRTSEPQIPDGQVQRLTVRKPSPSGVRAAERFRLSSHIRRT